MLDGRVPKPPVRSPFREVSLTSGSCRSPRSLCVKVRATVRKLKLPLAGTRPEPVVCSEKKELPSAAETSPGDADGISIITAIPRRTVKVRVKGEAPSKRRSCLCVMVILAFSALVCAAHSSLWEKSALGFGWIQPRVSRWGFTEVFTGTTVADKAAEAGLGVPLTTCGELDDHCRSAEPCGRLIARRATQRQRSLKFNLGKKRWESRRSARDGGSRPSTGALIIFWLPDRLMLTADNSPNRSTTPGMSREVRRRLSGWDARRDRGRSVRGARLVYVPPTIRVKDALSAPLSGVIS